MILQFWSLSHSCFTITSIFKTQLCLNSELAYNAARFFFHFWYIHHLVVSLGRTVNSELARKVHLTWRKSCCLQITSPFKKPPATCRHSSAMKCLLTIDIFGTLLDCRIPVVTHCSSGEESFCTCSLGIVACGQQLWIMYWLYFYWEAGNGNEDLMQWVMTSIKI